MYHFIVNPNSRSGLGFSLWSQIEPELKKHKIDYTVFFTQYQKHAWEYTEKLTSDHTYHTLVVLGGDGTVNEVINGIRDLSKVTLGYIPTGSSNDFARSFKIPSDPLKALEIILSPSDYSYMDVGCISYQNKKRRFAVSSGIGFDAGICHEAVVSRFKIWLNKIRLGKFTYALIALHRLFLTIPADITLRLDRRNPVVFRKGWFVTVMNHPFEGGGLKFCPAAKPNDGYLDIIVVSGFSPLRLLSVLPFAFAGLHTRFHGVRTFRCKTAEITTNRTLPVHTDGEPIFLQCHLCVSMEKKRLKIIIS